MYSFQLMYANNYKLQLDCQANYESWRQKALHSNNYLNERNEIRVCNFVATKSHSQFEMVLKDINNSLKLYGHPQPSLFNTDNISDKKFLEDCFPSLRDSVTPVEKHGHLEEFIIPSDVPILIKNNTNAINDAMHTILDEIPQDQGSIPVRNAPYHIEPY